MRAVRLPRLATSLTPGPRDSAPQRQMEERQAKQEAKAAEKAAKEKEQREVLGAAKARPKLSFGFKSK